jgi:hypothetical protein
MMRKPFHRFCLALVVVITSGAIESGVSAAPTPAVPLWVRHVQSYPGGISAGVRAMISPEAEAARTRLGVPGVAASPRAAPVASGNVQMNDDSFPPLPQNETAVAVSSAHPLVAVAAANDYVSGGVVVMRTSDGGRSWLSTRITPQFSPTRDFCNGGDPSVAYSARDSAFYLAQLCFFRELPHSEVQVYKSIDNGATWNAGRTSAIAASNFNYKTGTENDSIFNDKEYIAVDNTPTSPHYGRLYVTYTKFHMRPNGFSDYCPIQLAYTDNVPTINPALTTFTHVKVVPDAPGDNGIGPSADQFSVPVIQNDGTLDVLYTLEECNTSLDHGFRMQKSTNGGTSFLRRPVTINKPGQWKDNPDLGDLLPNKKFRAPNTPSMAYSPTSGKLVVVYQNYINKRTSGADISYQTSSDGGLNWSNTAALSVAGGGTLAPNDQFFPWIAADPAGHFYAIWLDNRLDPGNHLIDTFQATSINDFASFDNTRISTRSWDPDLGFFTSGAFIGDYSGIAASSAAVYPVWTDGRDSAINQTGIGETDIFTNVEIH